MRIFKLLKILLLGLVSFVVTIFIGVMFEAIYADQDFNINQLHLNGYDILDSNIIVSNCDDGQIVLNSGKNDKLKIYFYFDERPSYDVPIQIYYTVGDEAFCEEQQFCITLHENKKMIQIPIQIRTTNIRVDLGNQTGERFKIKSIFLRRNFVWTSARFYIYWIMVIICIIAFLIDRRKADAMRADINNIINKMQYKILFGGCVIFSGILLWAGVCFNYGISYLMMHFNDVPLHQLLYHLHTPLDGTNMESFNDVIIALVLAVFVVITLLVIGCRMSYKYKYQITFIALSFVVGVMLITNAAYRMDVHFGVREYYEYTKMQTDLYDKFFVDGRDISIEFPETKRNLIYIYLESMEIAYADKSIGGEFEDNLIQELTQLCLENICFSEFNSVQGGISLAGTGYTIGALIAQTSGIPINTNVINSALLNETWESNDNYFPGVWAIGDILEQQGYIQEFMCGSDGKFAGRSAYFKGHGNYDIIDYCKVIEQERISSDYHVWWGYEDEKLFNFAKEDLMKLAASEYPFNLTMLTADTHFMGGYICDLCKDEYSNQYSNVIACSSHQVTEFINWVKQQDFFSNTTIVIAGDHPTMDSDYIVNEGGYNCERKVYFAIINPAPEVQGKNRPRIYSTFDFYPTTLAALGVNIEGDRLGLGVNLFSSTPSLLEEFDKDYLDGELMKNSDVYNRLVYGDNSGRLK